MTGADDNKQAVEQQLKQLKPFAEIAKAKKNYLDIPLSNDRFLPTNHTGPHANYVPGTAEETAQFAKTITTAHMASTGVNPDQIRKDHNLGKDKDGHEPSL